MEKNKKILISIFFILSIFSSFFVFKLIKSQGLKFPPRFPKRLAEIGEEINYLSDQLYEVSEKLKEEVVKCDCSNLQSRSYSRKIQGQTLAQFLRDNNISVPDWIANSSSLFINLNICQPLEPAGDPCPTRGDIENLQGAIVENLKRISYLRELLKKEKEGGMLEKELKTLREDDAQILRENLDYLEELLNPQNLDDKFKGMINPIGHNCQSIPPLGTMFNWEDCIKVLGSKTSVQIPIKVKLFLNDWSPGRVGIDKIKINLPLKININKLFEKSPLKIELSVPEQRVEFRQGSVHFFTPTIPVSYKAFTLPAINFSIDDFLNNLTNSIEQNINISKCERTQSPSSSTEISPPRDVAAIVFASTTEGCANLGAILNNYVCWGTSTLPSPPYNCPGGSIGPFFGCRNHERRFINEIIKYCATTSNATSNTITGIYTFCERYFWGSGSCPDSTPPNNGYSLRPVPEICVLYGGESGDKKDEIKQQLCDSWQIQNCASSTIKTKAEEKCQGEIDATTTLECIKAPLIIGEFPNLSYPTEISSSVPVSNSLNCPSSSESFSSNLIKSLIPASTLLTNKISLPDLIIPDLDFRGYDINLSLFGYTLFHVGWPAIIIEDIITPDIELCDLSLCKNIFPEIRLPSLSFQIPPIPSLSADVPEWMPQIEIKEIQFPIILMGIPQLQKPDLRDFISYHTYLNINQIPSPNFSFSVGKLDWARLIIGSALKIIEWYLGIDIGNLALNQCIGATIPLPTFVPLSFDFPEYYISWPQIPRIPPIPFCKDINQFCQNVKNQLGNIVQQVENKYKNTLLEPISEFQKTLDAFGKLIQKTAQEKIQENLNEYRRYVENNLGQGRTIIPSFVPLSFDFPEYYISWPQIPRIPPIPFCKDINQFCQNVKNQLGNIVSQVEEKYKKTLLEPISDFQKTLDIFGKLIQETAQEKIKESLNEYRHYVEENLAQGRTIIPSWSTTTEITWNDIRQKLTSLGPIIQEGNNYYLKLANLPVEISLPNSLSYELPRVPLSRFLKIEKEFNLKLPFQIPWFDMAITFNEKSGCEEATGPAQGNITGFNYFDFSGMKNEIASTTQKIIEVLK